MSSGHLWGAVRGSLFYENQSYDEFKFIQKGAYLQIYQFYSIL